MEDGAAQGDGPAGGTGAWTSPPGVLLAIEADGLFDSLPPLPEGTRVVRATWRDLGATLIARALPDCVLAPLIGTEFDAIELAHRVCGLGYRGRLLVCAPNLPNLKLVGRELNSACEGLTVELIQIA